MTVVGAPADTGDEAGTVDPVVEASVTDTSGTGARRSAWPLVALAALVVVLAVVAGFLVFGWVQALQQTRIANASDAALTGARQAAINLNSVDPNNLDDTFANIASSITGDELTNGLNESRGQFEQMFSGSGVTVTATAHRAGLSAFDYDDGTAEALVVLDVSTARPELAEPAMTRLTVSLDMQNVDGAWRASQIAQLGNAISLNNPAGAAAAPDQQAPADQQAPTDQQAPAETGTP
ncbi:hypothetical protein [Millisia brevis]|uniref:hypothetical protein n=1 Tax=Millisia brevis TaxID=264148 RepID=UPI0008370F86|nr:hypothetical protein [Millisia brevis]